MNLDKFKAGSWWLLEQDHLKWVFMVCSHIKKSSKLKYELTVFVCSVDEIWEDFVYDTLAPSVTPEYSVFTPLPSRQAALDLLHILRRNHE